MSKIPAHHKPVIQFYNKQTNFKFTCTLSYSVAATAQSVQGLGYGLDDPEVRILAEARDFSLVHNSQMGSRAHEASY